MAPFSIENIQVSVPVSKLSLSTRSVFGSFSPVHRYPFSFENPKFHFIFFIVACRPHVTDENEELSKNDGRCIRPRNVIVNEQFRFHVSIREHENGVFKNSYSREGFGKLRFR